MFWNTLLLPLIAVLNGVTSILIRRGFGLHSAIYDILLGLLNTVLFYSSLGIPTSLTKFLPEREAAGGRSAVSTFLRQAAAARVGLVIVVLLPLNLAAEPLAERLLLGPHGAFYIHLLSALVLTRVFVDLFIHALHSFLAQLSVNVLTLAQAAGEPALIGLSLALGYGIGGVVGALIVSTGILALAAGILVARQLQSLPAVSASSAAVAPSPGLLRASQFWRFAVFTYLYELSLYFGGPDFSRTVLAMALGEPGQVALFSVGYYVALMVVAIMVSGFRGVYRPMFARLRVQGDPEQLRRAFSAVSKVQVALLLPAGVGLEVMVADYIPLLYGQTFTPAVPVARLLVAFLFTETAFNLGIIILSIDQRYRPVLLAQGLLVCCAPVFLWVASWAGLLAAVVVLGSARVAAVTVGYWVSRRLYGVRFPWVFTARVATICAVMAAVLAAGRMLWPTSAQEALTLTLVGALVFAAGARLGRILGPEEADLVRRAPIPGSRWLLAWLGATT